MSVCRRFLQILLFILMLVLMLGCGHDQQLVSITIEPATETFGAANIPLAEDAALKVQLRALGTYIHPPVTKDITTQVTWTSNTPQMVTVDAAGVLAPTGLACGTGALVSATVNTNKSAGNISSSGAIVTGTMTANVVCPSP